jgi:hypothetical protein
VLSKDEEAKDVEATPMYSYRERALLDFNLFVV